MITKSSEQVRVSPHDADFNNVVRPSCVLRYMQEAALMEFYRVGRPLEALRKEGLAFIVSRISFTLSRPIYAYEHLTAESWACPSSHASFIRCSHILSGEEEIAALYSIWALVDLHDRHLVRTEEFELPFGLEEPLTLDLPPRVRMPAKADWEEAGSHFVTYADADVNRHMNNTNYPDMLCSALPSMEGKFVSGMSLAFLREAAMGDTVRLFRTPAPDGWYVKTVGENGETGCESLIRLSPIKA